MMQALQTAGSCAHRLMTSIDLELMSGWLFYSIAALEKAALSSLQGE